MRIGSYHGNRYLGLGCSHSVEASICSCKLTCAYSFPCSFHVFLLNVIFFCCVNYGLKMLFPCQGVGFNRWNAREPAQVKARRSIAATTDMTEHSCEYSSSIIMAPCTSMSSSALTRHARQGTRELLCRRLWCMLAGP